MIVIASNSAGVLDRLSMLSEYLRYPFVRNAFIVAALISLCAAIIGVFLVLKRYSALGDGLSHVAFGAAAVAAVIDVLDIGFAIPITVLAAIFILRTSSKKRIMGDAAIAMLSVGALAIGYTVLSIFGGSSNLGGDVCTALFGSSAILSVGTSELVTVSVISALLVTLTVIFRHRLLNVTFDGTFARATGTKADIYDLMIAVICATVTVIGMELAGALLISSLMVFPALAAMRICKSFGATLIAAPLIGVICAIIGSVLSILLETPVGATVAAVDIMAYCLFTLIGKLK